MKFFGPLTVKRIIFYIFVLFLIILLVEFLIDPQGAIDAYKEGYNDAVSK